MLVKGFCGLKMIGVGPLTAKHLQFPRKLKECAVTMIGIFYVKRDAKGNEDYKSIT